MALVFAAAADVRNGRGQVDAVRREVKRAQILFGALSDGAASWYHVETRILLARACLRLSDVSRARTLLAEAERFLQHTPDSQVLTELPGDVRAHPCRFRRSPRRLYLPTNTAKTQAHATYRKLDRLLALGSGRPRTRSA